MAKIEWKSELVKLGDLKPWDINPRQSTKKQQDAIKRSFEDFGQVQTIAIGPDNNVLDGHQRLSALLAAHGPGYQIDARRASRALTEDERKRLVVMLHTGAVGSWDWDTLSGWDAEALQGWGMDAETLKEWNNDAMNLREMLGAEMGAEEAFGALPSEDRAPFQQMTFTLHDAQVDTVRQAMKAADAIGPYVDMENENGNGNALARICELFLGAHAIR